jgi:RHS repeat-associated protein
MCNPTFDATNNRITSSGFSFDSSGNTTRDAADRKFTYDAENKQTKAETLSAGTNTVTGTIGEYSYDGDGKRVKKYVPATGETTIFVYDAAGKLIGEYSTIVENSTNAKVNYLTSDHLGSPRVNTDVTGSVIARHDYYPFGEEIAATGSRSTTGYTIDTVRKQFTGYEYDTETGFDDAKARMHVGSMGRFTTPDPYMASAAINTPQSFNRYTYVLNNPLNLVDPTGMVAEKSNKSGCPEGKVCDENGNVVEIKDGVVVAGAVGTVTVEAVKEVIKETVKETIREPRWYEMWWYYAKKGVTTTGKTALTVGKAGGAVITILLNPTPTGCGASPGMKSDGNGGCVYDPNLDFRRQTPNVDTQANPDTATNTPTKDPQMMPRTWTTCLARGHLTNYKDPGVQEIVEATGSGPSKPIASRNALDAVQSIRRDGWYVRHPHVIRCWRGR